MASHAWSREGAIPPRPFASIGVRLVMLCGVLACASESSTTPLTALSPADQLAVAAQVALPAAVTVGLLTPDLSAAMMHGAPVAAGTPARAASAAAMGNVSAAALATYQVDRVVTCPAGGSAHTTGTLSGSLAAGGSGALTFLLFTTYAGCGVATDGRTLLLTADPGMRVAGSYTVTNRVPADPQTVTLTGTMHIAVSGSRASALPCPVSLTVTTSASTHVMNVSGRVCGSDVSRQLTWSP